MLPRAAGQSLAEFRRALRRARLAVDQRHADQRHQAAMAERRVEITPADDGMAHLYAFLPADGAQSRDEPAHRDRRSVLRSTMTAPSTSAAPTPSSISPVSNPMAPRPENRPYRSRWQLSTLLHFDDQPGELAGHGPIPAALARAIAADPTGTWRRLVTDEQRPAPRRRSHHLPSTGRAGRHIQARDRTCRFPHCHQPGHPHRDRPHSRLAARGPDRRPQPPTPLPAAPPRQTRGRLAGQTLPDDRHQRRGPAPPGRPTSRCLRATQPPIPDPPPF